MHPHPPRPCYWLRLGSFTAFALLLPVFLLMLYASYRWVNIYSHPTRITSHGAALIENNIPFQEVELITADRINLAAWYTPPKNGAVILLAHGYSDNRPESIYVFLAQHGYGVLAWDFRAHGLSGGELCTLGYKEQLDMEAALHYALAQPEVQHVGAWGGSMGAATVLLTAAKHPEIEAVISDSAYPSLEDVLKLNMPNPFLQPFVLFFSKMQGGNLNEVRPVDQIAKISPRAVFIIDGWEGGAIAMNAPQRLFEAANEPKKLWVEDGVPHLGMFSHNPQKYIKRVLGFLDEYLK